MDRILIIYPACVLVFITLFTMVKMRLILEKYLKNKKIKFSYLKVYKNDVPEDLDQARQHYKNQFEVPVLFYLLISLIYAQNSVNIYHLTFTWLFIFFRCLHCYIRVSTNYVPHRAKFFVLSLLMLLCGWVYFVLNSLLLI